MNQCKDNMIGKIHSIQSLGTLDGPGLRYVIFLQGCNLRCGCCHNPDTWDINDGKEIKASELVKKAIRYQEYFKDIGGITLSGGEPLLQAKFAYEIFCLAHKENINTCLDTSGSILNDDVKLLLCETDRVLLDIKYTSNDLYNKYVGCNLDNVITFLNYLNEKNIKTTIRQVIIPTLNDDKNSIVELKKIIKKYHCIDKVELLPFKKICQIKYDNLAIDFPFKEYNSPTNDKINELYKILNKKDS